MSGWGAHVGGDVSCFFTSVVGVGGFARYSAGSVELAVASRTNSRADAHTSEHINAQS